MRRTQIKEKNVLDVLDSKHCESIIYRYLDDDGEEVILKEFKNVVFKKSMEDTLRNKEQKLEILSSLDTPDLVQVKDLVFENGKLVGYTMKEVIGQTLDVESKNSAKIKYLEKIKEAMLRLNSQGINIGDFSTSNFIVDGQGNLTCIDIDNYRINTNDGTLDFDTTLRYADFFEHHCKVNSFLDRYCFNMFALCLIAPGYFSPSGLQSFPQELISEHNNHVVSEMSTLGINYQGNILEFKGEQNDHVVPKISTPGINYQGNILEFKRKNH